MHSFHLVGQCQINTVCSLILMAHQLHRMNHIRKALHTSSIHITKSKVKSWCTVLITQLITSTAMSKPSTISIYISIFTFQYFHFFTTCRNIAMLHDVCSRKSKTFHQIASICLIHCCDTQCDNNMLWGPFTFHRHSTKGTCINLLVTYYSMWHQPCQHREYPISVDIQSQRIFKNTL